MGHGALATLLRHACLLLWQESVSAACGMAQSICTMVAPCARACAPLPARCDRQRVCVQFGCFWTNGQICSATSRLLLHRRIASSFLARLKTRAESIRVCDPSQPGCRLGPIVCRSQYDKVVRYIEQGAQEGAQLLTGGADKPDGLQTGFYVRPTVFTGVKKDMAIWQEEIFGPVLSVMEFSTEEEAVALANDSPYGLAGAVISEDVARQERVARALDVGIVWSNCSQPCFCQVCVVSVAS